VCTATDLYIVDLCTGIATVLYSSSSYLVARALDPANESADATTKTEPQRLSETSIIGEEMSSL